LSATDPPYVVDCLMAAAELEYDLTLATRNVQDVARTGVKLVDPFQTHGPDGKEEN